MQAAGRANRSSGAVQALSGWRREVFGEKALRLVRGEIGIKFEKRRIAAFEIGND